MARLDDVDSAANIYGLPLSNDMLHGELPENVDRTLIEAPVSEPRHTLSNHQNEPVSPNASYGQVPERKWPRSLRVGYAAGAYDLFHIGHLNILRQAKQRCDYLIAGVVSDEMLVENKGISPFIPEDERLTIVQSIKFVDEAILETVPDKLDTWSALRFTVFFKGDDWRGTPKGIDLEHRFGEVGVDIEYLPYTLHTSSTKLRHVLDNFARVARSQ